MKTYRFVPAVAAPESSAIVASVASSNLQWCKGKAHGPNVGLSVGLVAAVGRDVGLALVGMVVGTGRSYTQLPLLLSSHVEDAWHW